MEKSQTLFGFFTSKKWNAEAMWPLSRWWPNRCSRVQWRGLTHVTFSRYYHSIKVCLLIICIEKTEVCGSGEEKSYIRTNTRTCGWDPPRDAANWRMSTRKKRLPSPTLQRERGQGAAKGLQDAMGGGRAPTFSRARDFSLLFFISFFLHRPDA